MSKPTTIPSDHITSLNEYISKDNFSKSPDSPVTSSEFSWIFKQREFNGFKSAFVKINARKFLVHIPTFTKCLAERRGI